MEINIYTDGSCPVPHGCGGWGFVIVGREENGVFGHALETTNLRMEMQAVIEALQRVVAYNQHQIKNNTGRKLIEYVKIYSDSQYVVKGMNQWIHSWKRKNWRNSSNEKVKNMDLWQQLNELTNKQSFETQFNWVKGHSGNLHNEIADELAAKGTIAARGELEKGKKVN